MTYDLTQFLSYKANDRLRFGIILKIGTIPLQIMKKYDEGKFFDMQNLVAMKVLNAHLNNRKFWNTERWKYFD